MPELFTLLVKINVALVLFCLGYYLVLRKLTFYTLNRAYLVTAIIFSSVYSFIDLSVFAQRHQQIVAPVQNIVIEWKAPAESLIKQAAHWNWLEALFWAGAALFAGRLLLQMISLYRIYRRSTGREINGQKVRVVSGAISPFSFWQTIFINPEQLSPADLHNVIEHERVHVKEWHTLDILLSEISVIFYWFNPGVWMMKRAVRENIEFITDQKILQKGTDSRAYQYSLLNVTFHQSAPAITSNFNFSTLKKRIVMMNAKRSSTLNLTRYALLGPVVAVCLLTFSLSKAEVVKNNPAFKAIAAAVNNISSIKLSADTVPVKKSPKEINTKKDITINTAKDVAIEPILKKLDSGRVDNDSTKPLGFNRDSVVIIVDGKVFPLSIEKIDPNSIRTVTVIKDNAGEYVKNILGSSEPVDAKIAGAVIITTGWDSNGGITPKPGSNNIGTGVVGYGNSILRKTDTAGSASRIRLRNTATRQNPPLVVVDGKEQSIEQLNQDDIETMTVLKSTTAISLYGEKAKHGVIVITTKAKKQ